MSTNLRSLTLIPTVEQLSARRTSKLQYLEQQEQTQEEYGEFLAENLRSYKEMIRECSMLQTDATQVDSRSSIEETLRKQNRRLQKFLGRVTLQKQEALRREEESCELSQSIQKNEGFSLVECENKMQDLVKQSEAREKAIQDLESEISAYQRATVDLQHKREAVLTEKEKRDLLSSKEKTVKTMTKKLVHLFHSVREDNDFLKKKIRHLDRHFDSVNSMLMDSIVKRYDLQDMKMPRLNVTTDEFWNFQEEELLAEISDDEVEMFRPGKSKVLESKIKKFNEQQDELLLKLQAIQYEISSAKTLNDQLVLEKTNLEHAVSNNHEPTEKPAEKKLVIPSLKRCNSDPLDYTDPLKLFQTEKPLKPMKTEISNSSIEYDYSVNVSNIVDSQMNSELYIDSLLMDVFDISHH